MSTPVSLPPSDVSCLLTGCLQRLQGKEYEKWRKAWVVFNNTYSTCSLCHTDVALTSHIPLDEEQIAILRSVTADNADRAVTYYQLVHIALNLVKYPKKQVEYFNPAHFDEAWRMLLYLDYHAAESGSLIRFSTVEEWRGWMKKPGFKETLLQIVETVKNEKRLVSNLVEICKKCIHQLETTKSCYRFFLTCNDEKKQDFASIALTDYFRRELELHGSSGRKITFQGVRVEFDRNFEICRLHCTDGNEGYRSLNQQDVLFLKELTPSKQDREEVQTRLSTLARQMVTFPVQWTIDLLDWEGFSTKFVACIKKRLQNPTAEQKAFIEETGFLDIMYINSDLCVIQNSKQVSDLSQFSIKPLIHPIIPLAVKFLEEAKLALDRPDENHQLAETWKASLISPEFTDAVTDLLEMAEGAAPVFSSFVKTIIEAPFSK